MSTSLHHETESVPATGVCWKAQRAAEHSFLEGGDGGLVEAQQWKRVLEGQQDLGITKKGSAHLQACTRTCMSEVCCIE